MTFFNMINRNSNRGSATLTIKQRDSLAPRVLVCVVVLTITDSVFTGSSCVPKIYPAALQRELKSYFEYFSFYLLTSDEQKGFEEGD